MAFAHGLLTLKLELSPWMQQDQVTLSSFFDLNELPCRRHELDASFLLQSVKHCFDYFVDILKSKSLSIKFLSFGLVVVAASVACSHEVRGKVEDKMRRRELERIDRLIAVQDSKVDDNDKCVVCLEAPRTVIVVNCGHFCLCTCCAAALPNPRRCPICRSRVKNFMAVFNP